MGRKICIIYRWINRKRRNKSNILKFLQSPLSMELSKLLDLDVFVTYFIQGPIFLECNTKIKLGDH